MFDKRSTTARLLSTTLGILTLATASSAQTITEVIDASGDGAGNSLENSISIAAGGSGNVYITGLTSNNLFKITPEGAISMMLEMSGTYTGLGIAVDSFENVYVSGQSSVFKITPGGVVSEPIDFNGDGTGNQLSVANQIALDSAGNLYVTGLDNAFKVTPAGVITEIIDATGDGADNPLRRSQGIAVDSVGNVYVTDVYSGGGHAPAGSPASSVFKITPAGVITVLIDETGDGAGNEMLVPRGIGVDGFDNVYVTGSYTSNVFKITPAGVISEIIDAGGDGAGNALDGAWELAVDPAGNAYVAGRVPGNAFKITPAGVITEIIDTTGDGSGNTLDFPSDIAVDYCGNVYISGLNGHNAFRIEPPSPGTSYCSSIANSTGAPALLTARGDPNGCLVLTSTPVPNTIGQFFYGPMTLGGTSSLGDGLRCVGGSLTRMLPFVNAGMMMQLPNTATLAVNYGAPYATGLTGTRHFQYWFRSGIATGTGSNTSNALTITF